MATAIQEVRAESPNVVVIDAGDSLVGSDSKRRGNLNEKGLKKAEVLADFLKITRPESLALGEFDLVAGAATATGLLDSRGLTPITTNLTFADPAVRTVTSRSWETAGYRFVALNLFAAKSSEPIPGVTISDPLAAFEAALVSAGKTDVLLVSCHRFDDAQLKKLASMPGPPRIVIDADGSSRIRVASSVSQTIFVKPPSRGTDLLVADLYLKRGSPHWYRMDCYSESVRLGRPLESEAAAAANCSLIELKPRRLTASISGHAQVQQLIARYKEWARAEMASAEPKQTDAPKYLGVESCGSCHVEQLANWKTTLHSIAWKTLEDDADGGAQDPECVSCHVSGFQRPGGPWKIEDTGPFRGVQCESCHLPLEKHPGGEKYGRPKEDQCRTCHSEAQDPDFDFITYLKYSTCTKPHDPAANRVPR